MPGPQLPDDPDVEAAPGRRLRVRMTAVLLVFIGGTVGTAARHGLTLVFPPVDGVPYVILGANIAGALLLGVLLETLTRAGTGDRLRLLLGTGGLGGFTTYSALAADTALLTGSSAGVGIGYAIATVVIGGAATWAGIAIAMTRRGRP